MRDQPNQHSRNEAAKLEPIADIADDAYYSWEAQEKIARLLEQGRQALKERHQDVMYILNAQLHDTFQDSGTCFEKPPSMEKHHNLITGQKLRAGAMEPVHLPGGVQDMEDDRQYETMRPPAPEYVPLVKIAKPSEPLGVPDSLPVSKGDSADGPTCAAPGISGNMRPVNSLGTLQPILCEHCGNAVIADALFCSKCGKGRSSAHGNSTKTVIASEDGHEVYKVLPAWQHKRKQHGFEQKFALARLLADRASNSTAASSLSIGDGLQIYGSEDSEAWIPYDASGPALERPDTMWFTVYPYSKPRGVWDILSLLLLMYDIIVIPLDFFQPPEVTFITACNWLARVFWTLDMVASCITGYVTTDGSIQMRQRLILQRYLKTWFVLDALVVTIDWAELFARSAAGVSYARVGKVTRTFRIIRMVRLLRIARMKEVVSLITERLSSQKLLVIVDISKFMFVILAVAHLIACVWFGIGIGTGTPPRTWVDEYGWRHRPLGCQYVMSLHWSIAQFAGGMDEITPENPGERIYAMVALLLAFIMAAFFISSLTSSMTELQILGSSEAKKVSLMRAYMTQHNISSKLVMRVTRNAQHSLRLLARHMPESQVELLQIVSEPLRRELHFEIFAPVFQVHPFFREYIDECPQVMRRVCHSAARFFDISSGDEVFHSGEIPTQPQMYFVCSGTLKYGYIAKDGRSTGQIVNSGEWISEAVLWTLWMHRGDLHATSNCRLCVLEAQKFQDFAVQFHHRLILDPKEYAAAFVKILTQMSARNDDYNDLTDLSRCAKDVVVVPHSNSFSDVLVRNITHMNPLNHPQEGSPAAPLSRWRLS